MSDTGHMPYRRSQCIGLADAVRICVRKFATFSGRAPRAEFWKFLLALFLAQLVLIVLKMGTVGPTRISMRGPDGQPVLVRVVYDSGIAGQVLAAAGLIPLLAVSWRRLHDTDRSGWWLLAPAALQIVLFFGTLMAAVGPDKMWALLRAGAPFSVRIGSPLMGMLVLLTFAASWIALIVTLSRRGTPGPNRFGPNPLEVTQ